METNNTPTTEEEDGGAATNNTTNLEPTLEPIITNVEEDELVKLRSMTHAEVMLLRFTSMEEGESWYQKYSFAMGFGIRKERGRHSKVGDKGVINKTYVCSREGERDPKVEERKTAARMDTRCGCKAKFQLKRDKKDGMWFITSFVLEHTHELVPKHQAHYIPGHRHIDDSSLAQLQNLTDSGIKTCDAYKIMVHQAGGHDKLRFTKKDAYNRLHRENTSTVSDIDVKAALSYQKRKRETDEIFFLKYTCDDEGRLENIFWTDSMSISDYSHFGELLAFDTTYKKNAYNMPLVIFSGVNHHFSTCVFGSALLKDETESNYRWVLETLTEAMGGNKPSSVITDGDKSMKNAIMRVFPDATRRLCLWHLQKNVTEHVKKSKSPDFAKRFYKLAKADLTEIELELQWKELVESANLQHYNWINKDLYESRQNWARAYLRNKFYAGVTSSSRCEGLNSMITKYVTSKLKLKKFFIDYDRWLEAIRQTELKLDFKSNYGMPEITTEACLELIKSVANLHTYEAYMKIKGALKRSIECIKENKLVTTEHHKYEVGGYKDQRGNRTVTYDLTSHMIQCSCLKFEYMRLPCRHMMFVLKEEKFKEFPRILVQQRWSKNPKSIDCWKQRSTVIGESQQYTIRYGLLQQYAFKICHYGASTTNFDDAHSIMKALSDDMEMRKNDNVTKKGTDVDPEFEGMKNPLKAKAKGSGKRRPSGQQRRDENNLNNNDEYDEGDDTINEDHDDTNDEDDNDTGPNYNVSNTSVDQSDAFGQITHAFGQSTHAFGQSTHNASWTKSISDRLEEGFSNSYCAQTN
ncbi:Protein FAR1-RELATED SEQUENCE 5 [Linum perenne]